MRVPDDLRDCVCFLRSSWASLPSDKSPTLGTAFFVSMPVPGLPQLTDAVALYLVTAKHCVEHKTAGLADSVELFINRRSGGFDAIPLDPKAWTRHPTSDVAITNVIPDHSTYAYRAYPIEQRADAPFVRDRNIGAGDDVFVTGLLIHHPGVSRLMPIVRVGNVAALPPDPVSLPTGPDVVALIEARSIGGLSGSPVFLHLPFWRDLPAGALINTEQSVAASGGEHRLLGVMHGFYPVGANDPDGVSQGREDLNTGIAVVVLIDRVMDLINGPDQVMAREAAKARFLAPQPVPTATTEPDGSGEFEAFEALTDKLLRVSKIELNEKLAES
jgi:hypothetical protein